MSLNVPSQSLAVLSNNRQACTCAWPKAAPRPATLTVLSLVDSEEVRLRYIYEPLIRN